MARPEKDGLEYFSHDTDMFDDPKIKFLKAKHGLLGYAIYNRLLEMIYREHGYFSILSERDIYLFADENKIDFNVCNNIVNDCINESLFDHDLFEKYSILTSRRIQKNYVKGSDRRKLIIMFQEFLLIDPENQKSSTSTLNIVIVSINGVNVNNNSINSYKSTQREREKERESKKKGKGKEKETTDSDDLLPLPLNDSPSSLKTPESIISEAWNRKPKNNSEKKAFEQMISTYGYDETLNAMQIATSRSKPDDCLEFAGYVEGILKKGGTQEFKAYSKQELQELGNKRNTPNIFEFYVAVRLDERSSFEPFYVSKEDQRKFNLPVWIVKNKEEPLPLSAPKQDWGKSGFSLIQDVERLQQEAL